MKKLVLFFLVASMFSITSCSKDDDDADIRDQAIGKYKGTVEVLNDGMPGTPKDVTFELVKDDVNSDVEFNISTGTEIFSGKNIKSFDKGFTFEVEGTILNSDDFSTLKGFNAFTIKGKDYQGVYYSEDKKNRFKITL